MGLSRSVLGAVLWLSLCACGGALDSSGPIDLTDAPEPQTPAPVGSDSGTSVPPSVPQEPSSPPATVPAPLTGPVAIQVDTSGAPDLASHLAQVVIPFLERWYPEVGDRIARPAFEPPDGFSIVLDPGFGGLAQTEGAKLIRVQPNYVRSHPEDLGMWLHEATHVMQGRTSGTGMPGWVVEGIADFAREFVLRDRAPHHPTVGEHYESGYAPASFFLNWIQEHYAPELIRKVMAANHGGTYSESLFLTQTGKGLDVLWQEMMGGTPLPGPIHLVRSDRTCLDLDASRGAMKSCAAGVTSQRWGKGTRTDGTFILMNERNCLGALGALAGSGVGTVACGEGSGSAPNYLWKAGTNGELIHSSSGLCLTDPGNGRQSGSALTLQLCVQDSSQRFTLPY